ncbi:DsbA family protein [Paracoccus suum]|uniref:DsbA family protein n=1 Tax=Paracoccus suum TaxID=2259340 RepID=A0A344PP67_9RHOB|nr:DsbA family protein [Paracoccus suum]AXC51172.1 DsbA family protein [Paracoccus suum]
MPTRRHALALIAAASGAAALPAAAQRANAMPEELRKALERDPGAPVLGNPDGDITLTEFFDYNCPFCRKMLLTMQKLIGADPKLRVVLHEWPVFGEGSEFAARAALASLQQGKYWQMHSGLLSMSGRAEQASVLRVARKVGLDIPRLEKDMQGEAVSAQIDRSIELADHMGLVGTPTLICGDEAVFGENSLADLQALVARGRKTLAS